MFCDSKLAAILSEIDTFCVLNEIPPDNETNPNAELKIYKGEDLYYLLKKKFECDYFDMCEPERIERSVQP